MIVEEAKDQAKKITKKMKRGLFTLISYRIKKIKVRMRIISRKPKTRITSISKKVKVTSYQKYSTHDKYSIIRYPVSSESAIRTTADNKPLLKYTLAFMVDSHASK